MAPVISPLTRLTLWRDRRSAIGWALGVALLTAYAALALTAVCATAEDRRAFAVAYSSPMAAMFTGPGYGLDAADPSLGAILATTALGYLGLIAVLAGLLMSIARTRADEEIGPGELLRAAPVGRSEATRAALASAVVVGSLMGAVFCVITIALGLAPLDALAAGLGLAASTVAGAGGGLVVGALAGSARAARGLGALLVVAWYQLRGLGDSSASAGWLSWTTPIGLVQQARPWAGLRWGPLVLLAAGAAVLCAIGRVLHARREMGEGVARLPAFRGERRRGPGGAVALALRASAATRGWWLVVGLVFALVYGAFAPQVESSLAAMFEDNPTLRAFVGGELTVQAYLVLIVTYGGLLLAACAVALASAAAGEEAAGRVAVMLAGPITRGRWLLGHAAVVVAGVVSMGVAIAVSLAASAIVPLVVQGSGAAAEPWVLAAGVAAGCASTLPAALLLGALTLAAHAIVPRASRMMGWGVLLLATCVTVLGRALKAPQWLLDLSPFTRLPSLPTASAGRAEGSGEAWGAILGTPQSWVGPGACLVVAGVLLALAAVSLRHRDLVG
ncbi:hypothetical protein ABXS69_01200 [Actinomyces timonensis]|uniref:ABC-2 family transporter protein n=1 Tax=Actinomyces timonensis TaxID=1288391 RepID=A0AAU8N2I5_9ACTO